MACVNCQKIRAAILRGKMGVAAGHAITGLREMVAADSDKSAGDAKAGSATAEALPAGDADAEMVPAKPRARRGK